MNRIFVSIIEKLRLRFERKKEMESLWLRSHYEKKYAITIGLYSYGCFDIKRIPIGTNIGRYCSFSNTSQIFNGNHGVEYISTHPYLYNTKLGLVSNETIQRNKCFIEDDVWLGHNSIILPSVSRIGRGSIIGAGAVVTSDVPRYAVITGNPGKVVKYRFSDYIVESIEKSKWWLMSKEELRKALVQNNDLMYAPKDYFI